MERKEFEFLVGKALDELPQAFRDKLENVDIVIEDKPDMDTIKALGLSGKQHILGHYRGVPLKSRTHYYGMVLPDKITLYQSNIERAGRQKGGDVYKEIKRVLEHEIAHHFGLSDRRLRELGVY